VSLRERLAAAECEAAAGAQWTRVGIEARTARLQARLADAAASAGASAEVGRERRIGRV
jgi:hypothetical protein